MLRTCFVLDISNKSCIYLSYIFLLSSLLQMDWMYMYCSTLKKKRKKRNISGSIYWLPTLAYFISFGLVVFTAAIVRVGLQWISSSDDNHMLVTYLFVSLTFFFIIIIFFQNVNPFNVQWSPLAKGRSEYGRTFNKVWESFFIHNSGKILVKRLSRYVRLTIRV